MAATGGRPSTEDFEMGRVITAVVIRPDLFQGEAMRRANLSSLPRYHECLRKIVNMTKTVSTYSVKVMLSCGHNRHITSSNSAKGEARLRRMKKMKCFYCEPDQQDLPGRALPGSTEQGGP